jgi:ketosteroid isomerase-like protein
MKADTETEKEIIAVLEKFSETYSNHDINGLLSLIAPDPDVVVYGLEPDEKRIGLDGIKSQLERDWSQKEDAFFEFNKISVSAAGTVAWVAIDAFIKVKADGQSLIIPSFITGVLEKRGDDWLIIQGHFSVPYVRHGLNVI